MSFYESKSGMKMDGSEENANLRSFTTIPDGTRARAVIKDYKYAQGTDPNQPQEYYEVTYQLLEGEFKSQQVTQKIKAFELDPKKRDRAINQMIRLFNLCNYKPKHKGAPTDEDLKPMQNKIIGIEIGQWVMDYRTGNFVRGTYPSEGFEPCTGTLLEVENEAPHSLPSSASKSSQAYSNVPPPISQDYTEDDIPF